MAASRGSPLSTHCPSRRCDSPLYSWGQRRAALRPFGLACRDRLGAEVLRRAGVLRLVVDFLVRAAAAWGTDLVRRGATSVRSFRITSNTGGITPSI